MNDFLTSSETKYTPSVDQITLKSRPFFKNAIVYRLPMPFQFSAADLEERLDRRRLTPCGTLEAERTGWVNSSVLGRTVHAVNGQLLIAMGHHKKLLPSSMIKQEVERRVALLTAEQGGVPVGRKRRSQLKYEVRTELLAQAMVRTITTRAWLDTVNGWLVVDASSSTRAERLTTELRDALGTLAVTLLETEQSASATMTAWLRADEAPLGLALDTDLELQNKDGATVRYTRHALDGADIKKHLEQGKLVTKLGLTWKDRVAFVLTNKIEIKRLDFLTLSMEKELTSDDEGPDSPEDEQFDADLLLMSGDLATKLAELSTALNVKNPPVLA